uniref:Protein Mdm4 n=1 Tax=Leptobrachium leishanense TaxID=445787 RepID=A0A8C5M0V4_9ANUR
MSISTSSQRLAGKDHALHSILGSEGNPVMHYLGQYITVKQLYDKQQQHIVHCGTDELGKLLGITTFSVKDPRPLYEMLKKNLYRISTDAAQSPSRDQAQDTGKLELEKAPDEEIFVFETQDLYENKSEVTCSSSHNCPAEDGEESQLSKHPRLDLAFEEWDEAGLPWWFLGNLRTNYFPQSNGSTDIPSNQDMDTALVSDTTDDLWFLNDVRSDPINVEVKLDAADSHNGDGETIKDDEDKKVIKLAIDQDDLEDTQSLSDDTDTEISSEDCWQCTNCHNLNSPVKRYCFRCWALRKDWYMTSPRLTHTLSTPAILANSCREEDKHGIDIPDCRRTVSAPMVRPQVSHIRQPVSSMDPLDLAASSKHLSESTDTLLSCQADEVTLESSRTLLEPCKLCQRSPRNGNVVHGRTAHLVACFSCAQNLKKMQKGCPVCQKPIQMVVKTYIA